jgi:hypothetical protein
VTALDRLKQQINDLSVRFVDEDDGIDDRALLQQLRYLGPHCLPSQGVVGKIQPGSKPPGNLSARQLHDQILSEAKGWVYTLGGEDFRNVLEHRAMALIPDLAQRHTDRRDHDGDLLHGAEGLHRHVGRWHLSACIAMGYDRPSNQYPSATCPECHVRHGCGGPECCHHREPLIADADPCPGPRCGRERCYGTLRARDTIHGLWVFCSNHECKDDRGQRTEFSLPYLRMMIREAKLKSVG